MNLKHVAIIMDGNGRWAKQHGVPTISGHKAGAEAARLITEAASELGISYLTLYTFSSENWQRDHKWIEDFFSLLRWYFRNEINALIKKGVCIKIIGNTQLLPSDIQALISEIEQKTKENKKITVVLALSYGGRDEILRACKKLINESKMSSKPFELTESVFESALDTHGIPDPDFLIRTSGEQRLSNFLLWQLAYSEFVFIDVLWPDFTKEHFLKAIYEYSNRERRYGLYTS